MATQFSGGTIVNTQFNGRYKGLIMMNIMNNLITAGWTSQAMSTGYSPGAWGYNQGPGNASAVTLTLASPGIVNWTGHGFLGGERIMFQNDQDTNPAGFLPSGLSINTYYYVKYIDANSFNVSGSYNGGNINFTGYQSGTIWCYSSYILMQSATQPNVTNPIVVRLNDFGQSAVVISVQNSTGTVYSNWDRYNGAFLIPVSYTNYQIIATRYHFFCFTNGTNQNNRTYAHAGMLYVPNFLSPVTDEGFVLGDTWDSETGTTASCWRNTVCFSFNNTCGGMHIWNQNIATQGNQANAANYRGQLLPLILAPPYWPQNMSHYRWANDWYNTSDILLSCGTNTIDMEGKIRGQFFDSVYIPEAFQIDATDTFNGHDWQNITNNNISNPRGGVWVAVT